MTANKNRQTLTGQTSTRQKTVAGQSLDVWVARFSSAGASTVCVRRRCYDVSGGLRCGQATEDAHATRLTTRSRRCKGARLRPRIRRRRTTRRTLFRIRPVWQDRRRAWRRQALHRQRPMLSNGGSCRASSVRSHRRPLERRRGLLPGGNGSVSAGPAARCTTAKRAKAWSAA